ELRRFKTRRREATLISLQDRNGEILGPPSPEIQVNGGAALAYRNHLALDQRKMALFGQHCGGVFGVEQVIIRTGPKAKLGSARGVFAAEEFRGTGPVGDSRPNARGARCDQLRLRRALYTVARGKGV